MKNKKLFAILTLICFALTMMPVAAFAAGSYAEVNEDYNIAVAGGDSTDTIVFDLTLGQNVTTDIFYVFAMQGDNVSKALKGVFATKTIAKGQLVLDQEDIANLPAGNYDFIVVDANKRAQAVMAKYDDADLDRNAAAKELKVESNIVMLDKAVTIKAPKTEYTVSIEKASAGALKEDEDGNVYLQLPADAGYTEIDVYAKLEDTKGAVVGKSLKMTTNSSAVEVTPETATTNAAGLAKFTVAGTIAGDFKIYVEYGTKADCTLNVKTTALNATEITTTKTPAAPVALDSTLDSKIDVRFAVKDANGNNAALVNTMSEDGKAPIKAVNYRVAVVEKPAGAKVSADSIFVTQAKGGWAFNSDETLNVEGTYTFKVILNNGCYATATIVVKEFQTPVALQLEYPAPSVELNGKIAPSAINFVDVNGVTKPATGIELSANGYAVKSFTATGDNAGTVEVKDREQYIGSKITVLAVSTKYNLTAKAELVVAKDAAAVKYLTTKADVAVNNSLVANIVDEDGNKVALNKAAKENNAQIQYIVLAKPENAKVALSTKDMSDLVEKGQFVVSFTASQAGEYQIQTVVRYEQAGGQDEPVVKYYSGIETITVGNTGIKDVVVMSIGSNEVVINADKKVIDAAPIVENSRTFVPFRALAEAFGATVDFDATTQSVTASLNGTTVVMTIGSADYTVNGAVKTADVAPFISGSRTYVPVRFVAEAFGIKVTPTYDEQGATADVIFAK